MDLGRWLGLTLALGVTGCGLVGFDAGSRAATTDAAPVVDGRAGTDAAVDALACAPIPCAVPTETVVCDGRCYSMCPSGSDFTAARATCQAWGGDLAQARTPAEQACLAPSATAYRWLGMTQTAGQTDPTAGWRWIDGSLVSPDRWAPLEPNDNPGGAGTAVEDGEEDCGTVYDSGDWNDNGCSGAATLCVR